MSGLFFRLGALNAASSVAIYAMGSHRPWDIDRKMIFNKAFELHITSAIGMMLCTLKSAKYGMLPALLLLAGCVLFSGIGYYRCFSNDKKYNYLMPAGGVCVISGWGLLALI